MAEAFGRPSSEEFDSWLWESIAREAPTFASTPLNELADLNRDAVTGRRVRQGGKRGAAISQSSNGPDRDILRAQFDEGVAKLRKQKPEISDRELAKRLAPKVRRAESTLRTWLSGRSAGSSTPHRSTR